MVFVLNYRKIYSDNKRNFDC